MNKNLLFRSIPKVDTLLENSQTVNLIESYSRDVVMEAIRSETEKLRKFIAELDNEEQAGEAQARIDGLLDSVRSSVEKMNEPNMRKVINATGTILHTNLGRAPISRKHMEHLTGIATGYSNLEYNLEAGKRGERYSHFDELLCKITGAEAAIAVNNNAAAVMLILSTLAKGGEVVVSRGELVEIGGKFRVPDVMEQSGATLVDIGTTNKTHYSDYEDAITEETKALLKVHTSNYRIVGFTESVGIDELKGLAEAHDIPVIEDLGSGVLLDLSKYGITYEPTVQDSVRAGADVVCFSGDKLLGGPQAGIIVGRKKYIDMMKKNPLMRALRIDKFTATALESVLLDYLSEEQAVREIPVLQMITKSKEDVRKDARYLMRLMKQEQLPIKVHMVECESQIGGGSLPLERIPSVGLSIRPVEITTEKMEERMRSLPTPVIPRVVNGEILMDLRTMNRGDFRTMLEEWKITGLCSREGQ